jgi:hypothetical protein
VRVFDGFGVPEFAGDAKGVAGGNVTGGCVTIGVFETKIGVKKLVNDGDDV